MKTDARVVYTLKVVKENFIKLLKEYAINKITVKKLCDEAGINRATFYRYYEDVFDLYNKLKDEIVENFFMEHTEKVPYDLEKNLIYLLSRIKENADALNAFTKQNDVGDIVIKLCRKNYQYFDEYVEKCYPEISKDERVSTYYYISSGCTGVISEWMNNGMKKSEKDVAALLKKLLMNTIIYM
ncbi:MAG: TetR/AcrR family transcriptional regulator [Clostridia bacterium]|nr:TetR/AcrR family transcriptional regulator [Clostridia bacterium]